MNRERLATFVGNFTQKMSDIYYDGELNEYYVHYKEIQKAPGAGDLGMIQYFNSEEEAELAASKYAFGDKNGNSNV
jgi:hypothetical protein